MGVNTVHGGATVWCDDAPAYKHFSRGGASTPDESSRFHGDDDWHDDSSPIDALSSMSSSEDETTIINPATGLPMVGGMGGIDVGGNAFGTDHANDGWLETSLSSASWSESSHSDDFSSSHGADGLS